MAKKKAVKKKKSKAKPKGLRTLVDVVGRVKILDDCLSNLACEYEATDDQVTQLKRKCDVLEDVLKHLRRDTTSLLANRGAVAQRLGDYFYRMEKIEERLNAGPGLAPIFVTDDASVVAMTPVQMLQMAIQKLTATKA
jgi:hypothetical protein